MNACFSTAFALLNVNDRVKLVPCFAGSPKSPDANLSFIEIESRLREKIRVNAAELRQVSDLHRYYQNSVFKKNLSERRGSPMDDFIESAISN